jgi:hypothetical protein
MRWLRFSIASGMAFILYAAIGLAVYVHVGDPWYGRVLDDAYYTVTVFILAIATILSVLRHGRSRAVWLGFAVFGWVHLLFGWPDSGGAPQRAAIVTNAGFDGAYRPRFAHTTLASLALFKYTTFYAGSNPLKLDYTWHVLQSTVTLATALVGALVGSFLWRGGEIQRGESGDGSIGVRDSPSAPSP